MIGTTWKLTQATTWIVRSPAEGQAVRRGRGGVHVEGVPGQPALREG